MYRAASYISTALVIVVIFLVLSCKDKPVEPAKPPITSLSLARIDWHVAARPIGVDSQDVRFKTLWHYIVGENVPNMQLVFRPPEQGSLSAARAVPSAPANGYASLYSCPGIMLNSSFKYLSITVRGRPAVFRFEYGWFNQDVDGNQIANSEGLNHNGDCEASEDVGLDGVPDSLEPGHDLVTNPDPNGDDFYFEGDGKCPLPGGICDTGTLYERFLSPGDPLFYEYVNGTEGNRFDLASLGHPDQEQLSQPIFNFFNSYYSILIDLTSDSLLYGVPDSAGWRTYHIPLLDQAVAEFVSDIPAPIVPDPSDMKMIRIWTRFLGTQTTPDTLEFRDLHIYYGTE